MKDHLDIDKVKKFETLINKLSIKNKCKLLAILIDGEYYVSNRGVPLIKKTGSTGIRYSICWFNRSNKWRVFWPYGFSNKKTYSTDFTTISLLIELHNYQKLNLNKALYHFKFNLLKHYNY